MSTSGPCTRSEATGVNKGVEPYIYNVLDSRFSVECSDPHLPETVLEPPHLYHLLQ